MKHKLHLKKSQKAFFEGWYFKHQNEKWTIAVIPAFHVDEDGKWSASIQVITNIEAHYKEYPLQDCEISGDDFFVKLGNNTFSERGIHLDFRDGDFELKGNIQYTPFTSPQSDVMGPFRFIPFMQCNHGVVSLTHKLKGGLILDGAVLEFDGGTGYAEKDWGTSFPKEYWWTQCSFVDGGNNCIMVSVADVPFAGRQFRGCICLVYYRGVEYRLATYRGVKIERCTAEEIILIQKGYRLRVVKQGEMGHRLLAPQQGGMTRTIHESPSCEVRYQFWKGTKLIFDFVSDKAAYEQVN